MNAQLTSGDLDKDPSKDLLLIGRRQVRSNNSWMHNSLRLVKGKSRCTAMIHPEDAKARKVKEGDNVIVESRIGKIEIAVEITDEIKQGVISIPHGWGHHRAGTRMPIAERHAGVSINDITDTKMIDTLTGTTAVNGVPVSLVAVNAGTTPKKRPSNKVSAKKSTIRKIAPKKTDLKKKDNKKQSPKKAVTKTIETTDKKNNSSDKEGKPENTDKSS
ncbi:MAG: hypothetical protein JKY67_03935 [Pseudomonadales bacterium]|nr:hypothetical protein [Pseudomonadales bacterium]